ncbi:hypothetical protein QJS10_CPB04g00852 [Acorus calamus]|uniref:Uncharacterized protein n=1 Tax=Acorus calamus TaxID=4465 RepID=A0AAV9F666_ACOCL|nr:hypothetical protein QJS10_CPB04g00852 [Acorus calamus]
MNHDCQHPTNQKDGRSDRDDSPSPQNLNQSITDARHETEGPETPVKETHRFRGGNSRAFDPLRQLQLSQNLSKNQNLQRSPKIRVFADL